MFSATFVPKIRKLATEFLKPYIKIAVGKTGSTTQNITQVVKYVNFHSRNKELLIDLKVETGRVIVFVERQRSCDGLCKYLSQKGVAATSIHGKMEQWRRTGWFKNPDKTRE